MQKDVKKIKKYSDGIINIYIIPFICFLMPQFNSLCEYLVDFNDESIPLALRGELLVNDRLHTYKEKKFVEGLSLSFRYKINDWHVSHKVWQFEDSSDLFYYSVIKVVNSGEIMDCSIPFSKRHFEYHYDSLSKADLPQKLLNRTVNLIGRVLYENGVSFIK